MKDADPGTSLQRATSRPLTRGPLGSRQEPPRYRVPRPTPPASTPVGIARTVIGLLGMPLLVVLDLGIETARTLGSVFSLRDRDPDHDRDR